MDTLGDLAYGAFAAFGHVIGALHNWQSVVVLIMILIGAGKAVEHIGREHRRQ